MRKRLISLSIIYVLLLILADLLFWLFLRSDTCNIVTFWISFATFDFSIFVSFILSFLVISRKKIEKRILGLPSIILIDITSSIFTLISLILLIINYFLPIDFVYSTVSLAFCVFFEISLTIVLTQYNKAISLDKAITKKESFIHITFNNLRNLCIRYKDTELWQLLNDICETANYSNSVSTEESVDIENEISMNVEALIKALNANNIAESKNLIFSIKELLIERNDICMRG